MIQINVFNKDRHMANSITLKIYICYILHFFQGVTDSYCYLGQYGTFFPMHCEDMDLLAINFLHWGQAKVWYIVAEPYSSMLDIKIKKIIRECATNSKDKKSAKCDNLLRHKDFIFTPEFLSIHKIQHTVIEQNAGEFVLTLPRSYHQGFNLGVNFAEATNYANRQWLQFGREGHQCSCKGVKPLLNMDLFKDY